MIVIKIIAILLQFVAIAIAMYELNAKIRRDKEIGELLSREWREMNNDQS
jgi:hypothetical protein